MAPKKKSPSKTVVKKKPKKGRKGAASVFPKPIGKTWSENDRGLPSSGHDKRRPPKRRITPAAKRGLQKLSKAAFGPAPKKPAAANVFGSDGSQNRHYPSPTNPDRNMISIWAWIFGEGWESIEVYKPKKTSTGRRRH